MMSCAFNPYAVLPKCGRHLENKVFEKLSIYSKLPDCVQGGEATQHPQHDSSCERVHICCVSNLYTCH